MDNRINGIIEWEQKEIKILVVDNEYNDQLRIEWTPEVTYLALIRPINRRTVKELWLHKITKEELDRKIPLILDGFLGKED